MFLKRYRALRTLHMRTLTDWTYRYGWAILSIPEFISVPSAHLTLVKLQLSFIENTLDSEKLPSDEAI